MGIFAQFIAVAAVLFAGVAQAKSDQKPSVEGCKQIGIFAARVMSNRQAGEPINILMEQVKLISDHPLFKDIINRAYDRPILLTDEGKFKEIGTFQNEIELLCFRVL